MLIVITGPSGCGKSTLATCMLTEIENLAFSVSHTTRKKREGEQEGRDYYFISTDRFEGMVKEGAGQIKGKNIEATFVFILPPLFPELRKRLETRGQDSLPVILNRLETAREEIQHYKEFEYIVINDKLDTASEELKSILMSQRCTRESREREIGPILRSFSEGE
jgi:guanylate kinase